MIKGLYFKLNVDNETDNEIYRFFITESKKLGINKIKLLKILIGLYLNETHGGIKL